MNDDELDALLQTWKAPSAPLSLRARVLREQRRPWWAWLFAGEVRVPVPVLLGLVALAAAFVGYRAASRQPASVSLSDFQPVQKLEPRIVRINYEDAR